MEETLDALQLPLAAADRRAVLWESTDLARSSAARTNEATYLADLIAEQA